MGKKQSTKWHANSKLLQQHFAKKLQASSCICTSQGAPGRGIGPPDIAGETTYQHCFEVNFA